MTSLRLVLGVLLLAVSLVASAAQDRAFFWKISCGDAELYLLGSIHFADDSFYPLREVITERFDAADRLVVEIDLGEVDPAHYMSLVSRYGRYPQGITIANQVAADTYQRLRKVLAGLGLPEYSMDSMRPGMAVADLTALVMQRQGFSPQMGIDMALLNRAADAGKPVDELETVEQQLRLFAGLPQHDLLLRETLDQVEDVERQLGELERAWKAGDEAALLELFIEVPEQAHAGYREINEALLYTRNRDMFRKLRRYLASGDSVFAVVGAAHLLGEEGLIALFEAAGYEVERR